MTRITGKCYSPNSIYEPFLHRNASTWRNLILSYRNDHHQVSHAGGVSNLAKRVDDRLPHPLQPSSMNSAALEWREEADLPWASRFSQSATGTFAS